MKFRTLNSFLPGLFLISYFLLLALPASAQIVPCKGLDCNVNHIFELLVNIYNFLLGMAALVAMLVIIWGGIKMLIFYMGIFDSPEGDLESGKKLLKGAIFGLILIAIAYLVVNTVIMVLGGGGLKELFGRFGFGPF